MICSKIDGGVFNFRACVMITDSAQTKILIQKVNDYWVLPGGRVEMLENTKQTIVRELMEELGLEISNLDLVIINENFFQGEKLPYHEIGFYYKTTLSDDLDILKHKGEFEGLEGEDYIYKWQNIKDIESLNLKPSFLSNEIKNIFNIKEIKHFVLNDL